MPSVLPVAKTLFLCEEVDTEGGLKNLYGLLNRLRPRAFPYVRDAVVAFAQLGEGLGEVVIHVDVRRASDRRLVRATMPFTVRFERRSQLLQLSIRLTDLRFDAAGVYLVELYGNNEWIGDIRLEVIGANDAA